MKNFIQPQQIYRHFKGNTYEIVTVATHTETEEELVIYRDVTNPEKVWARPKSNFLEEVNKPEYDYRGPRFAQV